MRPISTRIPLVSEWLPLARPYYTGAAPAHDLAHVLRVADLVDLISRAEAEDPRLPLLAALFHDAGRAGETADDHEVTSAIVAAKVMSGRLSADDVVVVEGLIRRHRYSKPGADPPSTAEAILRDADRLDALGFAGLARAFLHLGSAGRDEQTEVTSTSDVMAFEEHWREKLSRLAAGMHTPTARLIAIGRHNVMARFLEGMWIELYSGDDSDISDLWVG